MLTKVDKVSLSPRSKIPVIKANGREYYPWQYFWNLIRMRNWKFVSEKADYKTYRIEGGYTLSLTPYYCGVLFREYFGDWPRYYMPPFSLKGKIVLDVGAGNGETLAFYFNKGAEKVLAIEPDTKAFQYLKQNSEANNWPVELFNEPLKRKHLEMQFDFAKLDCEGGESLLFDYSPKVPIVLEAHSMEIIEKLGKLGFRMSRQLGPNLALMRNW